MTSATSVFQYVDSLISFSARHYQCEVKNYMYLAKSVREKDFCASTIIFANFGAKKCCNFQSNDTNFAFALILNKDNVLSSSDSTPAPYFFLPFRMAKGPLRRILNNKSFKPFLSGSKFF